MVVEELAVLMAEELAEQQALELEVYCHHVAQEPLKEFLIQIQKEMSTFLDHLNAKVLALFEHLGRHLCVHALLEHPGRDFANRFGCQTALDLH